MDLKILLSKTLRTGVSLACLTAFVGGVLYLVREGGKPFSLSVYQYFSYDAHQPASYTTWTGIWEGFTQFTAVGWIQMGVLLLILTPILRIVISLVEFLSEHDWLYAAITATVLTVILFNSVGGDTFV